MPSARTTLTEVATALGCLHLPSIDWAVIQRPALVGVSAADWDQLDGELVSARGRAVAEAAFANGQHFLEHPDALRGRLPSTIEWTGGRRLPGDQAIPADLRIDHVYLVSCKYLSRILLNTAPTRLFDGLLQPGIRHERRDWYELVAPVEHLAFAETAAKFFGLRCSTSDGGLDAATRAALKRSFGRHARLEGDVAKAYAEMCAAVSTRSARRWAARLHSKGARAGEDLVWRMLRFASGTYYVLGVSASGESLRIRVMTPWDWRQRHELRAFDIEPDHAGQPQVRWAATVLDRESGADVVVQGHVEVRWSHGRFGGPPEAKVYLDTPPAEVPGYVPLT